MRAYTNETFDISIQWWKINWFEAFLHITRNAAITVYNLKKFRSLLKFNFKFQKTQK